MKRQSPARPAAPPPIEAPPRSVPSSSDFVAVLNPEQWEILKTVKKSLTVEIPKNEFAKLKRDADDVLKLARVKAIAEIFPTLPLPELVELLSRLKMEITTRRKEPKPSHRPKEDHQKEERWAYMTHAGLSTTVFISAGTGEKISFTSAEADELIARWYLYTDKKTAQRRRKAYADKHRTLDKKSNE